MQNRVTWKLPLEKLPPGWLPPGNSHPEHFLQRKFPPRISPTWTIPTRTTPTQENSHPENCHPDNSHTEDSHLEKFSSSQLPPRIISHPANLIKWVQQLLILSNPFFTMHHFSTPWKYQKTVRFSDVFTG